MADAPDLGHVQTANPTVEIVDWACEGCSFPGLERIYKIKLTVTGGTNCSRFSPSEGYVCNFRKHNASVIKSLTSLLHSNVNFRLERIG